MVNVFIYTLGHLKSVWCKSSQLPLLDDVLSVWQKCGILVDNDKIVIVIFYLFDRSCVSAVCQ